MPAEHLGSVSRQLKAQTPNAATAVPLQTVIVIIAARSYVEEFLGELESHGLFGRSIWKFPVSNNWSPTKATGNGVYIYANGPRLNRC